MISHVLDTCALLDLAVGRWSDNRACQELKNASEPVVLCVSVWEIARKFRLGKLVLPFPQEHILEFVESLCERHQLRLVPLTAQTCHLAELLPPLHEDPFDRMILALAASSHAPVFTTDVRFRDYPVRVIPQRAG